MFKTYNLHLNVNNKIRKSKGIWLNESSLTQRSYNELVLIAFSSMPFKTKEW